MKRLLTIVLALTAIAYTGIWIHTANQVKTIVEDRLSSLEDFTDGWLIAEHQGVSISGFPLSHTIQIKDLVIKETNNSFSLQDPRSLSLNGISTYRTSYFLPFHSFSHQGPAQLRCPLSSEQKAIGPLFIDGLISLDLKFASKALVSDSSTWLAILKNLQSSHLSLQNCSFYMGEEKRLIAKIDSLEKTFHLQPKGNSALFDGDLETKDIVCYQEDFPIPQQLMAKEDIRFLFNSDPVHFFQTNCHVHGEVSDNDYPLLGIKLPQFSLTLDPCHVRADQGLFDSFLQCTYTPELTHKKGSLLSKGAGTYNQDFFETMRKHWENKLDIICNLPTEAEEIRQLQQFAIYRKESLLAYADIFREIRSGSHQCDLAVDLHHQGDELNQIALKLNLLQLLVNDCGYSLSGSFKTFSETLEINSPWKGDFQLTLHHFEKEIDFIQRWLNHSAETFAPLNPQLASAIISDRQAENLKAFLKEISDEPEEASPDITISFDLDSYGQGHIGRFPWPEALQQLMLFYNQ
ncbi:MAG: hypothetical protein K0S07_1519 [Chlamydiales bacterium]|jgi:hypothetical protein|nr:hypothetical protein [Chlamydiales bacterium]